MVLKAYKTELEPNNKQRTLFHQYAGTARFVFNWALADRQQRYEGGEKTNLYEQTRRFNALKREQCAWITDIPYAVMESAFRNCDRAFQNFFRRVKAGETPGYPKFKKRSGRRSFQVRGIKVDNNSIRTTGVGWVRLKESGYIPQTNTALRFGTYATISEQAGRWYISVLVEQELPDTDGENEGVIGVDIGIKAAAICSDGTVFENPKALKQHERKLARLQREMSRRKRGSKNRQKTQKKIQRCHAKIAAVRKHHQHEVSHYVTAETKPRAIVLEDLNVAGMVKNHSLAKAISDVGFSELRRQIEYKAEWNGCEVVIADRFYPSSKTCNQCGCIKDDLTLSDRIFVCTDCGYENDRDLNAALNLAALAEPSNGRGLLGELERSEALL